MKIALGTLSDEKTEIISNYFNSSGLIWDLTRINVDSGISDQPLSLEETKRGASNRARNALGSIRESEVAVGLESGLELTDEGEYSLVCVCVVVERNGNEYLGVSSLRPLPRRVSQEVLNGKKFGEEIRKFKKYDLSSSLDIEELITRKKSFTEAISNCFNQFRQTSLK